MTILYFEDLNIIVTGSFEFSVTIYILIFLSRWNYYTGLAAAICYLLHYQGKLDQVYDVILI